MVRRSLGVLLATTAALTLGIAAAQAGAFSSRQQSVEGAGRSYAGVAAPGGGLSGMFWNPAVVTSVEGRNSEWNVFGVMPQTYLEDIRYFANGPLSAAAIAAMTGRGSPGEIGTTLLTSASYQNLQIAENIFLGLSINAPYGSGTHPTMQWGGNWDLSRSRVTSINVQPVVGWKISPQISVAVGAQIQYFRFSQEQALAPLGPLNAHQSRVLGEDIGFGFTAGLTWTPFQGTALGIGYRSGIGHRLQGYQWLGATVAPGIGPGQFAVTADVDLPQSVTASIRQQIGDRLTVSVTGEWRDWSSLQTVRIVGSPVGSTLALNYRDGYFASIGADFRVNQQLTLRAGVGYEWTPVQDAFRSPSVPDSNRLWLSLGAGYQFSDRLTLNASYTYIKFDPANLTRVGTTPLPGPTTYGYTATTDSQVHIIGLSASFAWDRPAAPVAARF